MIYNQMVTWTAFAILAMFDKVDADGYHGLDGVHVGDNSTANDYYGTSKKHTAVCCCSDNLMTLMVMVKRMRIMPKILSLWYKYTY